MGDTASISNTHVMTFVFALGRRPRLWPSLASSHRSVLLGRYIDHRKVKLVLQQLINDMYQPRQAQALSRNVQQYVHIQPLPVAPPKRESTRTAHAGQRSARGEAGVEEGRSSKESGIRKPSCVSCLACEACRHLSLTEMSGGKRFSNRHSRQPDSVVLASAGKSCKVACPVSWPGSWTGLDGAGRCSYIHMRAIGNMIRVSGKHMMHDMYACASMRPPDGCQSPEVRELSEPKVNGVNNPATSGEAV